MLRLKSKPVAPEDEFLALPGAEPITVLQVANDNLPYACQCPLCGGVFQIPQGTLYEIEDDSIPDIDSGAEPRSVSDNRPIPRENTFREEGPSEMSTETEINERPSGEEE